MYSLNIKEIIQIANKNLKIIIICAVVFAILLGGFKVVQVKNQPGGQAVADEQRIKDYNTWSAGREKMQRNLEADLATVTEYAKNNPLVNLDVKDANYKKVTFQFKKKGKMYKNLISSWINKLSCKELFGVDSEVLEKYRRDLIDVNENDGAVGIGSYDVKGYDYEKVIDNIRKIIEKKLAQKNIKVLRVYEESFHEVVNWLRGKKDSIMSNVVSSQNALAGLQAYTPESPEGDVKSESDKSSVLIYGLLGLLIGALLGLLISLIRVIRRGIIVSPDQVEDLFGIEKLGQVVKESESDSRLVDKIIRTFSDGDNIIVISESENDRTEKFCREMDGLSEISYKYLTTSVDDEEKIKTIVESDNAVIPVYLGETTQTDIKNIRRWAARFKENIMGFVVIE